MDASVGGFIHTYFEIFEPCKKVFHGFFDKELVYYWITLNWYIHMSVFMSDLIIILHEFIRNFLKSMTVIITGAVFGIVLAFFIALIN